MQHLIPRFWQVHDYVSTCRCNQSYFMPNVTWKAKTTTNALPFNRTNRLYPFSIRLTDHVKAFKRFSHPLTKILYPFNALSKPFKHLLHPFTEYKNPFNVINKPFQRFSQPFTKISYPFNDLSRAFKRFPCPFNWNG